MEPYLMITQINDFLFCPYSIYYHDILRNSAGEDIYHETVQKKGLAAHRSIDEGTYSSRAGVITGMAVYCAEFGLMGRIDIFDTAAGLLTERKYSVTAVYTGIRYQLYAQYFALTEMGYTVTALRLHSVKDNKNYPVALPGEKDKAAFCALINEIRAFTPETSFAAKPARCGRCIYHALCIHAVRDAYAEPS